MTPQQTKVWARYHKAQKMLADATDNLILAQRAERKAERNTARSEKIATGAWAEYRAARAAMEALR